VNGSLKNVGIKKPANKHILLGIALGGAAVLVGYLGFLLQVIILGPPPTEYIRYFNIFYPNDVFELVFWIILSFTLIGICEELFSRGFIQRGLENTLGAKIGILVAAVLFSIMHLNPYRVVATFLEGLILGTVYYISEHNTVVSTISHGVLNSVIFILIFCSYTFWGI